MNQNETKSPKNDTETLQNNTVAPENNTVTPQNNTVTPENNTVAITNKINWKVRIRNKAFWLSIIPAVLVLAQVVAAAFGYSLDAGAVGDKLLAMVNALFVVLAILGVVADPTTAGLSDSKQALTYEAPKQKEDK